MSNPESKGGIDDSCHVLRYCSSSRWDFNRCGIPKVKRSAFTDSNSPFSFNWLEYYILDEASALVRICECHTHKNITKKGKFLKLKVSDILRTGEQRRVDFFFKHTPYSTNMSHASVKPSDKQAAHALYLCAKQYGTLLDVPEFRKIPIEKRTDCSKNSVETICV